MHMHTHASTHSHSRHEHAYIHTHNTTPSSSSSSSSMFPCFNCNLLLPPPHLFLPSATNLRKVTEKHVHANNSRQGHKQAVART